MKREKPRVADQTSKLRTVQTRSPERRKADFGNLEPNPPHGEKGDFRKITVTLPPAVYEQLVRESLRRKLAREKNHMLSALVREAVTSYLTGGTSSTK